MLSIPWSPWLRLLKVTQADLYRSGISGRKHPEDPLQGWRSHWENKWACSWRAVHWDTTQTPLDSVGSCVDGTAPACQKAVPGQFSGRPASLAHILRLLQDLAVAEPSALRSRTQTKWFGFLGMLQREYNLTLLELTLWQVPWTFLSIHKVTMLKSKY